MGDDYLDTENKNIVDANLTGTAGGNNVGGNNLADGKNVGDGSAPGNGTGLWDGDYD